MTDSIKANSSAFLGRAEEYITEQKLTEKGDGVLCALSGGGDSVALLYTLVILAKRLDITVYAAHFHHGIRGEEADRDAEFSRELCRKLSVPFTLGRADIPAIARSSGTGLEECAREQRYAFLRECANELGCARIATAHHATDNTETVIFHLLRGAGGKGLRGILPQREDGVIRPLLCFSKNEISDFLAVNSLDFVNDSTNSDTDMTRNFIRARLLPEIYSINPAADEALLRLSGAMREDEEYLTGEAKRLAPDTPLTELAQLPAPLLSRFIRLRYGEAAGSAQLGYSHTLALRGAISEYKDRGSGFRISLPGGIAAVSEYGALRFIEDKREREDSYLIAPTEEGEYPLPNGGRCIFTSDRERLDEWLKGNEGALGAAFYTENGITDVTVSSRRDGERYRRGGISRSVRKELNARRVPVRLRDSLPRFRAGEELLWVPPLPVGDGAKVVRANAPLKEKNPSVIKFKQLIYIGYTEN